MNEIIFCDGKIGFENGEIVTEMFPKYDEEGNEILRLGKEMTPSLVEALEPLIRQEDPLTLGDFHKFLEPHNCMTKGYGSYCLKALMFLGSASISFVMETPQGKQLDRPYVSVG